jgi:membrane protease YdiL (CAAX protease family)
MIRTPTGEVRLVWRLILVLVLFVAVEVLLRVIPIGLIAASMVKAGTAQASAVESARAIVFEDPIWSTGIGVLVGIMGFLIVWLLVRAVEKSAFTWKAVGLDWRRSSPIMILLGVLLALILFTAYGLMGCLLGSSAVSVSGLLTGGSLGGFFMKLLLFTAMGFSEEVVFRAYVQTRLSTRFGATWGVLGAALIFTLLHQISYNLSLVTMLSGILLWTTLGALYHLTQSLYLVGTFHALMNTMLNTLNFEVGDIPALIAHAFALLTLLLFIGFKARRMSDASNPLEGT